jgi:hypothetical protein
MSTWSTPSGASASRIALMMVCGAAGESAQAVWTAIGIAVANQFQHFMDHRGRLPGQPIYDRTALRVSSDEYFRCCSFDACRR